MTRGAVHLTL